MEDQNKKAYEISFLARGEEAAGSVIGHLSKIGAEILKEDKIDQINLAYSIDKHSTAHFGCIHFSADPNSIEPLEAALKFEDGILRYLIVTPPIVNEEQVEQKGRGQTPTVPATESTGVASNEDLEAKLEEISGAGV